MKTSTHTESTFSNSSPKPLLSWSETPWLPAAHWELRKPPHSWLKLLHKLLRYQPHISSLPHLVLVIGPGLQHTKTLPGTQYIHRNAVFCLTCLHQSPTPSPLRTNKLYPSITVQLKFSSSLAQSLRRDYPLPYQIRKAWFLLCQEGGENLKE